MTPGSPGEVLRHESRLPVRQERRAGRDRFRPRIITRRLRLGEAPRGYEILKNKYEDGCIKAVLRP